MFADAAITGITNRKILLLPISSFRCLIANLWSCIFV